MLKKFGLIIISLGISGFFLAMYFSTNNLKIEFIISMLISMASVLLGFSFLVIQSKKLNHEKYKNIFLYISILLIVLSLISKYQHWIGANFEAILAVFLYCFMYAPLELFLKNTKWRVYSNNNWEMLLLSSFDFVGINLIFIGILSRVMHWPGQYYLIYSGSVILLIGLVLWNHRFKKEVIQRKQSEDLIKMQYQLIENEKQISDNLLLNILPAEVAEELKKKGSAEAKQFDEVTVLFTDFKDFTNLSSKMSAKDLVEEVNTCFMEFDKIMENYGIEKIKTIGDSYMCAGGLPVSNLTHAFDVVNAGLEIREFIHNRGIERKNMGKDAFQIRIGIHTGPVVAGIVGIKKFAYDIWGDTVNTASRMENKGEPGKVNISGNTFAIIKDKYTCTYRGKIEVKGKGALDMYFVEGKSQQ